jgi:anthranilate phosphoribosyltransferase
MTIQDAIAIVIEGNDLSQTDAASALELIMSGKCTPAQIAGLLVALRMKGETVEEITGFASTMREFSTKVTTGKYPLVDTCGTGGDASGSFNISTTAAFVVAGAGLAVAKHGNRSASSLCGSADVLEALGANIDVSAEVVGRCIDEVGIGFLFARSLHSAMKHVGPPRSELKTRTIFNLLGPLTNPAGADRQVIGVFDALRVEDLANVLTKLGTKHAFVVAGLDGLDELTLDGPSLVAESKDGTVKTYEISPEEVGLAPSSRDTLVGGDAETNAAILRSVLQGETGPKRDITVFNAAAALITGEIASDWKSGIEAAGAAIDSGSSAKILNRFIEYTRKA